MFVVLLIVRDVAVILRFASVSLRKANLILLILFLFFVVFLRVSCYGFFVCDLLFC